VAAVNVDLEDFGDLVRVVALEELDEGADTLRGGLEEGQDLRLLHISSLPLVDRQDREKVHAGREMAADGGARHPAGRLPAREGREDQPDRAHAPDRLDRVGTHPAPRTIRVVGAEKSRV